MVTLTPELLEKTKNIGPIDIVVGICTKNVEATIVHVMNVVASGLSEYFSDYNGLIIVSDGFSSDRTMELAEMFEPPGDIPKLLTEQMGGPGKGNGIRTIFEIASEVNTDTVVLIDGDLLSVRPEWIEHLGKPPIYGIADLVVPYYVRNIYDGPITKHIAYPLTRALYDVDIRQPIGGEFGLSIEFARDLLEHHHFPAHFGIDIFMTTTAAAEGRKIQETLLGLKLHESTIKYLDPAKHLSPMFMQVVGMIFDLMEHYECRWSDKPRLPETTSTMAKYHGQKLAPLEVDIDSLDRSFREGYTENRAFLEKNLNKELIEKLDYGAMKKPVHIGPELWSKLVFSMAAAYKNTSDDEERQEVLETLKSLWLGRFASFVNETQGLEVEVAEKKLAEQAEIFKENMGYMTSLYCEI
ncbi:MAG: glycosyl transferase family 2 [Halobacteriota archaeon]|nr:glycosyl transferase family 2 [Halobacteriota archaeon]